VVAVFQQIPQFGIYSDMDPSYSPPEGVLMWNHGTEFVTRLSELQQSRLGSDLAARVTYFAQCDPYDRLGSLFLLLEPKGQAPQPSDARIELLRFITPFSDYQRGALATHVYPNADVSAFADTLADPTSDVWIGIAGGSNTYAGDACTGSDGTLLAGVTDDFAKIGFSYSVDFVSTQPLHSSSSLTLSALANTLEMSTPIAGTFSNDGKTASGHITVIVSGHGSDSGGDEYENTTDSLLLDGKELGSFSTVMDCAPYAKYSPDGNQAIFRGNLTFSNPRNWCPGALVPSHRFPAKLPHGTSTVTLTLMPAAVPAGSYYATSFSFSAP
jgi:Peptide-N-glycosidase F, C terminal/Peptide-N-glycosidase F, N terminal